MTFYSDKKNWIRFFPTAFCLKGPKVQPAGSHNTENRTCAGGFQDSWFFLSRSGWVIHPLLFSSTTLLSFYFLVSSLLLISSPLHLFCLLLYILSFSSSPSLLLSSTPFSFFLLSNPLRFSPFLIFFLSPLTSSNPLMFSLFCLLRSHPLVFPSTLLPILYLLSSPLLSPPLLLSSPLLSSPLLSSPLLSSPLLSSPESQSLNLCSFPEDSPYWLPLYGNMCCRLVAQPLCMIQPVICGQLDVKVTIYIFFIFLHLLMFFSHSHSQCNFSPPRSHSAWRGHRLLGKPLWRPQGTKSPLLSEWRRAGVRGEATARDPHQKGWFWTSSTSWRKRFIYALAMLMTMTCWGHQRALIN